MNVLNIRYNIKVFEASDHGQAGNCSGNFLGFHFSRDLVNGRAGADGIIDE